MTAEMSWFEVSDEEWKMRFSPCSHLTLPCSSRTYLNSNPLVSGTMTDVVNHLSFAFKLSTLPPDGSQLPSSAMDPTTLNFEAEVSGVPEETCSLKTTVMPRWKSMFVTPSSDGMAGLVTSKVSGPSCHESLNSRAPVAAPPEEKEAEDCRRSERMGATSLLGPYSHTASSDGMSLKYLYEKALEASSREKVTSASQ